MIWLAVMIGRLVVRRYSSLLCRGLPLITRQRAIEFGWQTRRVTATRFTTAAAHRFA